MSQKLSRRDALKVLGAAAGATALANLPSKWTTPKLEAGLLPAHAATSGLYTLVCQPVDVSPDEQDANLYVVTSAVQIAPVAAGIWLHVDVFVNSSPLYSADHSTDPSGQTYGQVVFVPHGATLEFDWRFLNSSDGSATCSAKATTPPLGP